MISGLLLAAGESRRMGSFKQLLEFGGRTFVECCVDNLLRSRVGEVIVITGYREQEVRQALAGQPVRFVHNAGYTEGMASSIKRGIESLHPDVSAALIALVDQPQIGPDIINQVIEAYLSSKPLIVVPAFAGKNAHPVLIDMRLKQEVLAMDPSQGLRQVVHAHAEEVVRVDVGSDLVLRDFDYPEDYNRKANQDAEPI